MDVNKDCKTEIHPPQIPFEIAQDMDTVRLGRYTMLTDNELERTARKAGNEIPETQYTWLAFLGWIRWAYDLGAESSSSQLQDEKEHYALKLYHFKKLC